MRIFSTVKIKMHTIPNPSKRSHLNPLSSYQDARLMSITKFGEDPLQLHSRIICIPKELRSVWAASLGTLDDIIHEKE